MTLSYASAILATPARYRRSAALAEHDTEDVAPDDGARLAAAMLLPNPAYKEFSLLIV